MNHTPESDLNQAQSLEVILAPRQTAPYLREAYSGTATPRDAIRAKCLECKGHSRKEIRLCPSSTCPLHLYRPYQRNKKRPSPTL